MSGERSNNPLRRPETLPATLAVAFGVVAINLLEQTPQTLTTELGGGAAIVATLAFAANAVREFVSHRHSE